MLLTRNAKKAMNARKAKVMKSLLSSHPLLPSLPISMLFFLHRNIPSPMTTPRLYNTLTNQEEDFVPLVPNKVTMYTCGPTVYGRPHIGNYSSFLMADLLRRWLEVSGHEVVHVKNITDVGHLVADADEGEDKVEKEAKRIAEEQRGEGAEITMEDVIGVAEMYTAQYLEDEAALNMLEPHHRPKATETIPEMLEIIKVLVDKGNAYEADDGIYFAVESFEEYGKLSGNTLDQLNAGARVDVQEAKRHPADFALWKKCTGMNEHHVLRWDSPWGPGFPGWHIECSAMSTKFLGEQIDIHTGGEDNIFPHHECEIAQSESFMNNLQSDSSQSNFALSESKGEVAQSECCNGKQFVNLWLHKRRIDLGDQKMSKSLGNVLSVPDILASGYSPLDLRYLFLSVHYRTQLKFAEKGLEDAKKARRKIVEWIAEMQEVTADASDPDQATIDELQAFITRFADAMNSDLNTPGALAAVFDCMAWSRNQEAWSEDALLSLQDFIAMLLHTFGCFDPEDAQDIPAEVQELVDQRAAAREAKDFEASDRLRDEIAALGWEVRDGSEGQTVKKI